MHIQFAELPVFDQDRAKHFYIDNLGCTSAADAPYGEGGWRWIELAFRARRRICTSTTARTTKPRPNPCWFLSIRT